MVSTLVVTAFLPLSVALELGLAALLLLALRRRRAAGVLGALAFAVLFLASLPPVGRALARPLESGTAPVPIPESPSAGAIVVLGRAADSKLPPRLDVELSDASDRLQHAARLFRAGKAPLVVATGGAPAHAASSTPECRDMSSLLVEWGVPPDALLLECASIDTRQNALQTRQVLAGRRVATILLVTSAMHMRRAAAAFRRAGLTVIPSPTDFRAVAPERLTPTAWLPSAEGLTLSTAAIRERAAMAFYRVKGWV